MTIFDHYYHSFFSACGLPYYFDSSIALKSLDYKHIKKMANRKSLFEKKRALYLFLPPHSAHSLEVNVGHIMGNILRIFCLNSEEFIPILMP